MRWAWLALTMTALAALLVACGGSSTPSNQEQPTIPPNTPTTQTTQTSATTPTAVATSSATPAVTASSAQQPAGFVYGFNVFWRGDANGAEFNQKTIEIVKGAGFDWVRIPILWADVERAKNQWDPLPVDRLVEQYQGSGVKILATVSKVPDWARDPSGKQFVKDFADWEGFTHFLAVRYKGKIAAYEIWNEQNLMENQRGGMPVDQYARMLEAGYSGIKMADPEALVVFGGLTPTGVNDPSIAIDDLQYLKSFYSLRNGYFTKFFDVLGVHVNATNQPPDKMIPDNPGTGPWSNHPSFYFRRAEQLHQVMADNNDARPTWITEFGWTTANQAKGYEYGKDVTAQDQADYLVQAFDWARQRWPWTTGMFVWNLNYSVVSPPEDEKYPWSVLNSDWSPRPAYNALKAMPKS